MKTNYAAIGDDALLAKFYAPNSPMGFDRFDYEIIFVNKMGHVDARTISAKSIVVAKQIAREFSIRFLARGWKLQSVKRLSTKENRW